MAKSQPVYIRKGEKVMKAIQDIGYRHSNWQVFQDFIALSTISISNTVDWNNAAERETEYSDDCAIPTKMDTEKLQKTE